MSTEDIRRWIVIVLDGVGAGAAPDAGEYGDEGSNSLGNTARALGGISLPNFEKLGLGCVTPMQGVPCQPDARAAFGRMRPRAAGKDTIAGHWEMMGVTLAQAMPLFPQGFPPEVLDPFIERTGRGVLANIPASGTEIIQIWGDEHRRTGKWIVYTSGDSVFQLAAHEEVVPLDELYKACRVAREILSGPYAVGRVIARPFLGPRDGRYYRTENRHDFPLYPPSQTALDVLTEGGLEVVSVGKIDDIFARRGITRGKHTVGNQDSLEVTLRFMAEDFPGLLFVNLIEFDMIYGHRNDPRGYADALALVDSYIPALLKQSRPGDVIAFVSDHGVDPTTDSTDHSREYSPLLVTGKLLRKGVDLGARAGFADLGASILDSFKLPIPFPAQSFLPELLGRKR